MERRGFAAAYAAGMACAKVIACKASTPLNYSAMVASAPASSAYSCNTTALRRLARSTKRLKEIIQTVW